MPSHACRSLGAPRAVLPLQRPAQARGLATGENWELVGRSEHKCAAPIGSWPGWGCGRRLAAADPPPPCPSALQRLVARQRGALQVRAASTSSNDFKNGMTIEMDGAPYKVVGAFGNRGGRRQGGSMSRGQGRLPACLPAPQ